MHQNDVSGKPILPASTPESLPSQVTQNNHPGEEKHVTLNLLNSLNSSEPLRGGVEGVKNHQEQKPPPGYIIMPLHLPLGEYLVWVYHENRRRAEFRRTWESELWTFLRLVKAHPDLCHRPGSEAFRKVEAIMNGWLKRLGLKGDPWATYLGVTHGTAETEFDDAWDKIRFTPGLDAFGNALDQANVCPLELPWEHRQGRSEVYSRFISVAGWMQVIVGAKPILLPVRRLGELLDVTNMTISRLRTWAKKDGYIREVKKSEFSKATRKGRATEFVFRVACCESLRKKAQEGTEELFDGR